MRKMVLRNVYKQLKKNVLTLNNTNFYHSRLSKNFDVILHNYFANKDSLIVGSYIHKPISQIIPPLLSHLEGQINLKYAYPFFTKANRDLRFFQHGLSSRYRIGDYGIKVCADTDEKKEVTERLSAVLVPLVAFAQSKHRIGEGGGFYDMFIRKTRRREVDKAKGKKTLFIGVGLEALKIEENSGVFEEWDQCLDMIITEKCIYA